MNKLSVYRPFLQAQGFRPEVTDDFIAFAYEGGHYVLMLDDGDPHYFQMLFPCFWRIDSPEERTRALEAASKTTQRIKVAKVFLDQRPANPAKNVAAHEDTTAAIEMFLPKPEDFEAVFRRSLNVLQTAAHHFRAAMMTSSVPNAGLLEQMRRALGLGGGSTEAEGTADA